MSMYQNPLRLPGQWPDAGIGDPYVMRHNGKYYLYPSTPRNDKGVRVWVSHNLLDWEDGGYVVTDGCLQNAYAPEVFYYNGTFLMVASPFGEGHYLYASDSPMGPFQMVRDNFGLVIDGSLFADDDAKLYFTHAEYPAIHGHSITPEGSIGPGREITGTCMGHWTEGPGIFKRGGRYYITMTGNHLLSRGYRVQYAIGESGPLGPYRVPENKTILVNTDAGTGSLGHSSTVIGPDLDSYWIFYHSFPILPEGKRHGRFVHMDRMVFSGEKLLVSGPTRHPCPAPQMPCFYGWADGEDREGKFVFSGNRVLTKAETPADYTAEVCAVPGDDMRVLFGITESRHSAVSIAGGKIALVDCLGPQEKILVSVKLFEGFRTDVMHTIRLEVRGGKAALLLDHMAQASGIPVPQAAGGLGTEGALRTSYIAFSSHVDQQGDFEHYHAVPGPVEAALFLPRSLHGCGGGHDAADCGFRPEDGMRLAPGAGGALDVLLSRGEFVTYRINAAQAGIYRLQAVAQAEGNAVLSVNTEEAQARADAEAACSVRRMEQGTVRLEQGMQTVRLSVREGSIRLRALELFPLVPAESGSFSGMQLCRAARLMEGEGYLPRQEGLQMDRPVQSLAMFGDRWHTDASAEADVIFRGDGAAQSAGLFLRLSEHSVYPDQIPDGHRGYYIGFDMQTVTIRRLDFGTTLLAEVRCPLRTETVCRLKVQITGGTIRVFVNGEQVLEAFEEDPLPYGCVGVGSLGARITVTQVTFNAE